MKFLRTQSGELVVDGANARMRKVLAEQSKREKLADFIVNGHDGSQVFTRAEIKLRIQKVARRIAEKLVMQ